MQLRALFALTASIAMSACGGGPTGPNFPTLSITTVSVPGTSPTLTYTAALEAAGGDGTYTWSVSGGALPTGFQIGGSSGILSGRTLTAGTFNVTVRVQSGDGQSATQALTIEVEPLCKDRPGSDVITFEDANLAGAVRLELAIGAQDDITCTALLGITKMYALALNIQSIVGIQHLTNLTEVHLRDNQISDISPLSGLMQLQVLVIGINEINDVSLLGGLSSALWDLDVGGNPINDISALASLTGMTKLYVNATPVSDISALQTMTLMGDLDLEDNPNLTDITALVNNPGIDTGDQVFLENSPVDCAQVATLLTRGVNVMSDCP